jgi:hypothetical protein
VFEAVQCVATALHDNASMVEATVYCLVIGSLFCTAASLAQLNMSESLGGQVEKKSSNFFADMRQWS